MSNYTQIQTLSLSQLTCKIAEVVQQYFTTQYYWVVADVTNHVFYPNKDHHYFELVEKDEKGISIIAKIQAVAWRAGASRIRHFETTTGQKFKTGIKVSVKVQVEYHAAYGLKLILLDVDPAFTMGQLELQRQATINRLLKDCARHIQKEGDRFVTTNNRLSHRLVIQKIAVLSSNASAGYQDFMHTLVHNKYGYRFLVNSYFTTVQGEVNAESACKKLNEICKARLAYDVIVIIRGGGADTDFLLFDQYVLCEAVAQLPIPVITGIGHLKNQTLVDLMAHTSANAPTKAAEYIVAHNHSFDNAVVAVQKKVVIKTQQILAKQQQRIANLYAHITQNTRTNLSGQWQLQQRVKQRIASGSQRLLHQQQTQLREAMTKTIHKPQAYIAGKKNELQNKADRLRLFASAYLQHQRTNIGHMEALCRLMSPVNILKKGFALIYHNQKIITTGSHISEGATITVRLADSQVKATVQHKEDTDGNAYYL